MKANLYPAPATCVQLIAAPFGCWWDATSMPSTVDAVDASAVGISAAAIARFATAGVIAWPANLLSTSGE
jgi:hypothetical protein